MNSSQSNNNVMNSGLSEYRAIPLEAEQGIGALTLPGLLNQATEQYPNREAACWTDKNDIVQRYSYQDVHDKSVEIARALIATGISKGSRVGILISNRPEWLFCLFGASMAGAVVVAMNTFSTEQELRHQLKVANIAVVLTEADVAGKDFLGAFTALAPDLTKCSIGNLMTEEFPFLRRIVCIDDIVPQPGIQPIDDFLKLGNDVPASVITALAESASEEEDAVIFFSSGSTALPKAIRQTQRASTLQCWRMANTFDYDCSVRTWNANGYFFSGNFAMSFATLCRGGCLVMLPTFQPDKALKLIAEEKVSCVLAWPHQEERLSECPAWETSDFSSVKWVSYFSTFRHHPSTSMTWSGFDGYGMTETFTFVSLSSGESNLENSQGKILPGNTIRIVDPQTGAIVPVGETGEIIIKGPTLMPGYIGIPPEKTFDEHGFLHTADAGYISEDGYLFWKGRLSDIIKTGGANVSPTEIDSVICEHPEVLSSYTVGIPHKTLGELVVSCIVRKEGSSTDADAIKQYAKKYLSGYKVPREIIFLTEDELPVTGSNKVKRSALKAMAAEILNNA